MIETSSIPIRFDVSARFREANQTDHSRQVSSTLRVAVLERDHHTCCCCGFHSRKYQDVLVIRGNVRDVDDMYTTCIFCHQCFHLDQVSQMRSGVLIWLPEVRQELLHFIARDIYVARISAGPQAEKARRALEHLSSRREEARTHLGTDNPQELAERMRNNSGEHDVAELGEQLRHIRLLPLDRRIVKEVELEFNMFPQILAYWRSRTGPYANSNVRRYPWLDDYVSSLGPSYD